MADRQERDAERQRGEHEQGDGGVFEGVFRSIVGHGWNSWVKERPGSWLPPGHAPLPVGSVDQLPEQGGVRG